MGLDHGRSVLTGVCAWDVLRPMTKDDLAEDSPSHAR